MSEPLPAPLAISRLARMAGRERVVTALSLPEGSALPDRLSDRQLLAVAQLARTCRAELAQALADEARASDDVHDTASAAVYLHGRLAELSGLLPADLLPVLQHEATTFLSESTAPRIN